MPKFFTATALLFLLPALATAQQSKKTYRWEDAAGVPSYGDSVPPEAAEQKKEVLNDAGITVDTIRGKKTEAEKAEEARQLRIAEQREVQRRADQALLATYLSVEEIEMHRDRRVELFQAQARVTELYLKNLRNRQDWLQMSASKYRPYSDDPNAEMITPDLLDDLNETKDTIARHEQNLKRYKREENDMNERFEKDISRFRRLKGIKDDSTLANSQ